MQFLCGAVTESSEQQRTLAASFKICNNATEEYRRKSERKKESGREYSWQRVKGEPKGDVQKSIWSQTVESELGTCKQQGISKGV